LENGLFAIVAGSDISFIREFGDINDPSSYKYTSLVKVTRSFKELTGNYSCQSVDGNPSLRKSIFIYVEGYYYIYDMEYLKNSFSATHKSYLLTHHDVKERTECKH